MCHACQQLLCGHPYEIIREGDVTKFLHVGKWNEGVGARWDLHITELVTLTWNKKEKSWIGCQNLAYNRCKSQHEHRFQIRGFYFILWVKAGLWMWLHYVHILHFWQTVKAFRRVTQRRKSGMYNGKVRKLWHRGFHVDLICAFLWITFIYFDVEFFFFLRWSWNWLRNWRNSTCLSSQFFPEENKIKLKSEKGQSWRRKTHSISIRGVSPREARFHFQRVSCLIQSTWDGNYEKEVFSSFILTTQPTVTIMKRYSKICENHNLFIVGVNQSRGGKGFQIISDNNKRFGIRMYKAGLTFLRSFLAILFLT